MPQVHDMDAQSMLRDVVNQFSDPMSFLRELIQNSIDAGSSAIDISTEYDASSQMMTIHVDDYGEGMSREIIETKLTRLFSSTKDDDFTKIGRFGIGFVSVFAIEPVGVCVDTGRAGEYWRVLFDQVQAFELIRLDTPVEGTQIRVFKKMQPQNVEAFEARALAVVSYWCKHTQAQIFVNGHEINQPFDIQSVCKTHYEEEGTHIVAGYVARSQGRCEYYNRGLTLQELDQGPWQHIHLKIDSRYLEHTLTRDQVLQDRHYHKAYALMEHVVLEQLPERLKARARDAAKNYLKDPTTYTQVAGALAGVMRADLDAWSAVECIPTSEGAMCVEQALELFKQGRAFWGDPKSAMGEAMEIPFFLDANDPVLEVLAQATQSQLVSLHAHFFFARPSTTLSTPEANLFCDELRQCAKVLGAAWSWIGIAHLRRHESWVRTALALPVVSRTGLIPMSEVSPLTRQALLVADNIVLNANNADLLSAIRVATKEPEWSAYTIMKMILLSEPLRLTDEQALLSLALERRRRRLRRQGVRP